MNYKNLNQDKSQHIDLEFTLKPINMYILYGNADATTRSIAYDFYSRIKPKELDVLLKYEALVKPKSFFDVLEYAFDKIRIGRHLATQHVLLEKTRPDLCGD